jgi:hypothetical protein
MGGGLHLLTDQAPVAARAAPVRGDWSGRHEPFGDGISGLDESPLDRVAGQLDAIAHP